MPKIGDIVRFLNDVGGGRVVRIEGQIAWVDDNGFETPALLKECVVVRTAEAENESEKLAKAESARVQNPTPEKAVVVPASHTYEDNIPGGDKLNITIGFEPTTPKKFSETAFDLSLVNDSNYFVSFTLATRDSESTTWNLCYCGTVEPNTELWIGTFEINDIARFERICFQYLAFKKDKPYSLKPAESVEIKVDTTKFLKLHCFRPNPYFENDVIAFTLVENDVPAQRKAPDLTPLRQGLGQVSKEEKQKRNLNENSRKPVRRDSQADEPLVVDLHIDNLVDNVSGMSAADMLNLQVETFEKVMKENLRNYGKRIIFIHGKGEGVLRQALTKELTHRYRGHDVQDASFSKYGYGATQVTIRQHPDKFNPHKKK